MLKFDETSLDSTKKSLKFAFENYMYKNDKFVKKKNLLFSSIGDNSDCYKEWYVSIEEHNKSNYNIILSYYGDDKERIRCLQKYCDVLFITKL